MSDLYSFDTEDDFPSPMRSSKSIAAPPKKKRTALMVVLVLFILSIIALLIIGIYNYRQNNSCDDWATIPKMDIDEYNLDGGHYKDVTMTQCKDQCEKTGPDCQWFTYDTDDKECWLKKGDYQPGSLTGFRFDTKGCPDYYVINDYDVGGFNLDDMPIKDISQDTCKSKCKEQNCNWYTYEADGQKCWLKKGDMDNNEKTTVVRMKY